MQFKAGSIVFLGIAAFSSLASAQTIAFGQELQENDQTNHWVAWIDGKNACPGQQILDVLTKNPCAQPFNIGEVEYTFTGCVGEGTGSIPTTILDSGGLQVGACSANDHHQINCHPPIHDIIKHGTCVIANNAKRHSMRFRFD